MMPFFTVKASPEYITTWAMIYRIAGMSVFELEIDGSCKPKFDWHAFQRRLATGREIKERFGGVPCGIGLVCGRISQLEVICFCDRVLFDQLDEGLMDITSRLSVVRTPQGPVLVFYRCSDPTESEVLSADPATKQSRIWKIGEGDYVVAVQGSDAVHQEIVAYEQIRGPVLPDCAKLTPSDRRQLLEVCRRL